MSHRNETEFKMDPTTITILSNLKNKIDQPDNIFGTDQGAFTSTCNSFG